jgi:hypothetical protein
LETSSSSHYQAVAVFISHHVTLLPHCHFFFRCVGTELPEAAGASAALARKLLVVSSFVWEGLDPLQCFVTHFPEV